MKVGLYRALEVDVDEAAKSDFLLSTSEKYIDKRVVYTKKPWENIQKAQGGGKMDYLETCFGVAMDRLRLSDKPRHQPGKIL